MRIYLTLIFGFILSIQNIQAQDSVLIAKAKKKILSNVQEISDYCLNEHPREDVFNFIYYDRPGRLHGAKRHRSFYNPKKLYFTKVDQDYYLEIHDLFDQLILCKVITKGSTSIEFGGVDTLISDILKFAKNEIEDGKRIVKEKQIELKPIAEKHKPLYDKIAPELEKINELKNKLKKEGLSSEKVKKIEKKIKKIEFKIAPINKEFAPIDKQLKSIQNDIYYAERRISQGKSNQRTYSDKSTINDMRLIMTLKSSSKRVKSLYSCNTKWPLFWNKKGHNNIKEKLKNLNTNPVTEMDHLVLADFFISHECFFDGLHHIYEAQKVAKLDSNSSNNSISSIYLKTICCKFNLQRSSSVTRKPVVYLYPTQEDTIDVNVKYNGELTFTYPKYNNGWKVIAKPNGQLTNLEDSTYHNYLFWEGETSLSFQDKLNGKEGWVIKGSEVTSFFQTVLPKYGLTPKEYNDFIVYWGPLMQKNKYNYINFYSNEEYNKIASIETSPKADTFLRLFMVYQALDHSITVREPEITTTKRKGFTLVEWGGAETYGYISNNP
ncbi:MAG: hypothetical protein GY827_07910 [Cytophagales bacterium]|nr:hypothetical protein [Cytophagales bacterium]